MINVQCFDVLSQFVKNHFILMLVEPSLIRRVTRLKFLE